MMNGTPYHVWVACLTIQVAILAIQVNTVASLTIRAQSVVIKYYPTQSILMYGVTHPILIGRD